MKATDLRKSILQAAVQGKLVPQDKNDEPASQLLKRIQTEKTVLIKEGKLKKEKPLPPITEDEIPYDLPEGWVWCRIGSICDLKNGLSKRNSTIGSEHYVLRLADIYNFQFSIANGRKIRVTGQDVADYSMTENDMGIIRVNGSRSNVGKAVLFSKIDDICLYCDHLMRMRLYEPACKNYIRYALNSNQLQDSIDGLIITTAGQNTISQKSLFNVLIPIPPLAEQQRIVAKVDELMALCDELEAAENEQDALEKHLAEDLPKTILQSAVQGKLVSQDKNDEPASELLKRIQAEKAALIKAGKLKKGKPMPPITEDEIPYNLPDGWVWCRLGEVNNFIMGQSPAGNSVSTDNQGLEFHQGKGFYGEKYLQKSNQFTSSPRKIAPPNSILLAVRAPVGDVNITKRKICIGRGLCALWPLGTMNINFMFYWLQAQKQNFVLKATGTTFAAVTGEVVKNQIIPLPPLAEQQRIVAKVDELMALCDELKHVDMQPMSYSKVVPFPSAIEATAQPVAMAARGDVNNLSAQAKQAIEDLFVEDE